MSCLAWKITHDVWNYGHDSFQRGLAIVGTALVGGRQIPYAILAPELGEMLLRDNAGLKRVSVKERMGDCFPNDRTGERGLVKEEPDLSLPQNGTAKRKPT